MSKPDKLIQTLRNLRRVPKVRGLNESEAGTDPIKLFEAWMNAAVKNEKFEPNAMTLATASADGVPTARTVLLKGFGEGGFEFYTNYASRKGLDLAENPKASLVFYWRALIRQVLIDGTVEKLSRKRSAEYFHSRPRSSQIAAYVSEQSQAVAERAELKGKMKAVAEQFQGQDIPCPDNWGGYKLVAARIEFWQGRPDRMHDRLCYSKSSNGEWDLNRLAP